MDDFLSRRLAPLGKTVHRLGLAMNYGIDAAGVEAAAERGVNYLFWTTLNTGKARPGVRKLLAANRERFVVATGPGMALFGGGVRRGAERLLRALQTDYLDIFQLFWLGKTAAWTQSTLGEVERLKAEGKIRALGVSIHDRPRAGRLAADPRLDMMMIRYNAAHPGAERDIFPAFTGRRPIVTAYTATSWRKLLRAPRGWTGPVMTAADCYRFCLSSPHVDVVLTGPGSRAQLEQTLAGLERGPLAPEEDRWMRDFGQAVHG